MHQPSNRLLTSALAGGAAGLIATIPMTLAMRAMFSQMPQRDQYPLPPRQITSKMLRGVGVKHRTTDRERRALTRTAHFGYGTTMGALYTTVAQPVLPGVAGGMVYGLGVWAGSYLGWLPAAGILPPATQMPAARNALMIAAHLIWGACLGKLSNLDAPTAPQASLASHQPAADRSEFAQHPRR